MAQYQTSVGGVNAADINAPLVQQYGPWPTAGIATGAAVGLDPTLFVTNIYTQLCGGVKSGDTINQLAILLTNKAALT